MAARPAPNPSLSHTDARGNARMVDVGDKPITQRSATAEGFVRISAPLAAAIRENTLKKGNLLETARLAGITAAKRTDELIPLCHTLPLDQVDVRATLEDGRVRLTATATTHAKTGVEMEALTAVTVAALTVIDMGKAIDKAMVIEGIRILEKRGGRNDYRAPTIEPS
jgi:cyclic pyranopterin monophosphate synthase